MAGILSVLSDALEEIEVPYEFGEWTRKLQYPYSVGNFEEDEHRYEDGYTGGTFTLNVWSRTSNLSLLEIKEKIKKKFEDLRVVQEGTAFFITYEQGELIPSGEQGLYRLRITLKTQEWEGE